MSAATIALILCAALAHALWNVIAKRAATVGPGFVFAYNLVSCIVYAPWAIAALAVRPLPLSTAAVAVVLLSGAIHLAYSLCLQRGYRVADLSIVYPVARGVAPLAATGAALTLMKEPATAGGILGLLLILLGITLVSVSGRRAGAATGGTGTGIAWGAGTGALIAAYTVVDAHAVTAMAVAPVLLDWFSNTLRFGLLLPVVLADGSLTLRRMAGQWPAAAAVGVLSPLGYILVLTALDRGAPLSLVAPLRETSMMVAAVLGVAVLRERVDRWRVLGCLALVAGAAAIAAA